MIELSAALVVPLDVKVIAIPPLLDLDRTAAVSAFKAVGSSSLATMSSNNDLAGRLYRDLLKGIPRKQQLPRLLVVQHQVPNTLPMLRALGDYFEIAAFIPKPKSRHLPTVSAMESDPLERQVRVVSITREELNDSDDPLADLGITPDNRGYIVLDVGGYFAGSLSKTKFAQHIKAIVEDTENGHQKYAKALVGSAFTSPITSVARSPLKEPEDFLVGQSIVYSVENILRANYSLLINRQALVLGYGKIGRSIANSLAVRNINVWVYDIDPIKRAQAMAHGFRVPDREFALRNSGVVFCATGQKSLSVTDFGLLKPHCFVASVTSADDEFDLTGFEAKYRKERSEQRTICTSKKDGKNVFSLINDGEAANFAHSNALGVYIYLVACEIIFSLRFLVETGGQRFVPAGGLLELSAEDRAKVANHWIATFFGDGLL